MFSRSRKAPDSNRGKAAKKTVPTKAKELSSQYYLSPQKALPFGCGHLVLNEFVNFVLRLALAILVLFNCSSRSEHAIKLVEIPFIHLLLRHPAQPQLSASQ